MLLDGLCKLGNLRLQLVKLLHFLLDFDLLLLIIQLLLFDLGRCSSPLGADLEEIGADALLNCGEKKGEKGEGLEEKQRKEDLLETLVLVWNAL